MMAVITALNRLLGLQTQPDLQGGLLIGTQL